MLLVLLFYLWHCTFQASLDCSSCTSIFVRFIHQKQEWHAGAKEYLLFFLQSPKYTPSLWVITKDRLNNLKYLKCILLFKHFIKSSAPLQQTKLKCSQGAKLMPRYQREIRSCYIWCNINLRSLWCAESKLPGVICKHRVLAQLLCLLRVGKSRFTAFMNKPDSFISSWRCWKPQIMQQQPALSHVPPWRKTPIFFNRSFINLRSVPDSGRVW